MNSHPNKGQIQRSLQQQNKENDYNNSQQDNNQVNNENQQKLAESKQKIQEPQEGQKLSKKQLKKIQKKQKWEQIKRQKRKQQREKQKEMKKKKKQQVLKKLETQQIVQLKNKKQQQNGQQKKKRKDQYKEKMLDGQKVVIDLQFYDKMTQKQQSSLGKQLAYCHSVNRKFQKSFNYIITSATQERLKYLDDRYNISNYGIAIHSQGIFQLFQKEKLVYLTGDADQQLKQFNTQQIYIIGGIVDHNRLKNITINYANQNNIKARRLPMQGLKLKASVHLAVNHVWEWMLRFYNGFSWKEAIKAVIPQRKLQQQNKIQQEGENNLNC